MKELLKTNPVYDRLLDLSSRIEGLSRHMAVHAAGVVIAPGPLDEYVPVCTPRPRAPARPRDGEDAIVTQYDMDALEKVGMLKMDFLGLTTLTVIHDAVHMIADRSGVTPRHGRAAVRRPETSTRCCARAGPPASSSSNRRSRPTCSARCAATGSTISSPPTR